MTPTPALALAREVTGETITDDQIRDFRETVPLDDEHTYVICDVALALVKATLGGKRWTKDKARAHVATLINARTKEQL